MNWYQAFPIGILIYLCYVYSKFKDKTGAWHFLKEYWDRNCVHVIAGFVAYVALFCLWMFVKDTINAVELFTLAWGPTSVLSAYGRVTNNQKQ